MNISCQVNSSTDKIAKSELSSAIDNYIETISKHHKKILIIPPDKTRKHSGAGLITNSLFNKLSSNYEINIMPALGTHNSMTQAEKKNMFGEDVPPSKYLTHNWRKDTKTIGVVPKEFISSISEGLYEDTIEVQINQNIINKQYDLIISIGQVLPHEVVGMANYTKNIVVGCGGKNIIDKSHYLGAVYGIEKILGRDHSPVRKLYDYIESEFLEDLNIDYIFTVNKSELNDYNMADIVGFFCAKDNKREVFEEAVSLSQEYNINYLNERVDKFLVYLNPEEFTSTWLANKAIYRTRMAVSESGEVIIMAPGLRKLGEDDTFDKLIEKYGYANKKNVIEYTKKFLELENNLAVAAHLIHGSTEGEFTVKYSCDPRMKERIEKVNYEFISYQEVRKKFDINDLDKGFNEINNDKIYFIDNPGTGLWVYEEDFELARVRNYDN